MARPSVLAFLAFAACVTAEPPVGYSYSAPAPVIFVGGHGGGGGGGGGGHYEGGGLLGGDSYHAVPHGYQTSEGQYIDPHLLEEIKHILLKDEIHNQQFQQSHSSSHLSSVYGAPSPVYGVPSHHERVVGIELDRVKQGIQVAQYETEPQHHGGYASGYSGGYSSGFSSSGGLGLSLSSGHGIALSSGHGGLSLSSGHTGAGYQTIAVPAGSYGVPLPSIKYGSPHH